VTGGGRYNQRMLRLRTRHEWWGDQTEVTEDDPVTLAEACYTVVAATLAEPLRRAFLAHTDEHGCGTPGTPAYAEFAGFGNCPEADRLWHLLPDGDRILIALPATWPRGWRGVPPATRTRTPGTAPTRTRSSARRAAAGPGT